jgi:hypothetical protein
MSKKTEHPLKMSGMIRERNRRGFFAKNGNLANLIFCTSERKLLESSDDF